MILLEIDHEDGLTWYRLHSVPDIARRSPAVASTPPAVPKQELSVTLASALEDNR